MPKDPFPDWNPFDAPGEYVPPQNETTQVRVTSPRNKSANKSTLVLWKEGEERTLEDLLNDEAAVLLAAEFMELSPSAVGWGTKKQQPFVFGPKVSSHPSGVYMLSEWFHAIRTGELRKLTPTENAVWGARLFMEMGLLDPAPLCEEPQEGYWMRSRLKGGSWTIPENDWNHLRVLAGFRSLARIHWLFAPNRPVAFTRHYAALWCGVPLWTTYAAIRHWTKRGWLRAVKLRGKRANHFLPGNGEPCEGDSYALSTGSAHSHHAALAEAPPPSDLIPWLAAAQKAQKLAGRASDVRHEELGP